MSNPSISHSFAEARRLIAALAFSADRQRRRGRSALPVSHAIAMAHILISEGGIADPLVLCAAILTGSIEAGVPHDELAARFGREVADIVREVSDDRRLDKAVRRELQVTHAAHISARAQLIKLADKIAHLRALVLRTPADWSPDRRRAYVDWTRQMVAGLRGVSPLLEAAFDAAASAAEMSATEAPTAL